MRKKTGKKFLCSLLAMIMVLCAVPMVHAATPFEDVPEDSWYAPYVEFVYQNGVMNGVSDTQFKPASGMTRAMIVTVLYRMEGEPGYTKKAPFTDLKSDSWYADAIHWGFEEGIVKGMSDTEFKPDKLVARQDMLAFVFRYTQIYVGWNESFPPLSDYVDQFDDLEYVSSHGDTGSAVAWAIHFGIINGVGDRKIAPKGTATRAQCAAILYRFVEWVYNLSEDPVPSEPNPQPTEPAPTEPEPTEPPHVHNWVHTHYEEEGHWGEERFICNTCGWTCSESEAAAVGMDIVTYWALYHQSPMNREDKERQHSYRSDADWVVDREAYDEWVCSGCGETTRENPNP